VNGPLSNVRRGAGAIKRRLFERPEQAAWRRACHLAERTPRFTPGIIRMAEYTLRYSDLLSFCPQWQDIFVNNALAYETANPAPRILDCGANIGLASPYFKRRYQAARITAFEADPAIAAMLADNLRANAAGDVEVESAAVWTSDGEVTFQSEGADSGTVASLAGEMDGRTVEVRAVRLAHWLAAEPIDLLKLDIEGAEAAVLQDCRAHLANVRALLLEIHEFDPSRRQSPGLRRLLEAAGFEYTATHVTPLPWRQPRGSRSAPFPHRSSVWVEAISAWKVGPR
jgi:FkbM family methyltransferase